jgi:hypothetical protein
MIRAEAVGMMEGVACSKSRVYMSRRDLLVSRTTHMAYHTVDNAKLDSHFDSFPVHGGLLDILSDLLGGL